MDRDSALNLLERLHDAQNKFYSGSGVADFSALLTDDIEWTVPGTNAIAGVYRGIDQVLDYFTRRRLIASATFTMTRVDVLNGESDFIAALTDGAALIGGVHHEWSTVGLYRCRDHKVAACWLLPLDPDAFDRIWSS